MSPLLELCGEPPNQHDGCFGAFGAHHKVRPLLRHDCSVSSVKQNTEVSVVVKLRLADFVVYFLI